MRVLLKLGGLLFAALLDVSVAVFILHILGVYFGQDLRWWHHLIVAPIIGVLPDFDVLLQYFFKKKIDDGHHSFMHIPPPMILAALVGGTILCTPFWGIWVASTLFFHYFHDSSMWDFGLKWLWPFTQNQYHFFGRKQIGGEAKNHAQRFRLIVSYTPAELSRLEREGEFVDLEMWLRDVYYLGDFYALLEGGLSAALVSLVLSSLLNVGSETVVLFLFYAFMVVLIGYQRALMWLFYKILWAPEQRR